MGELQDIARDSTGRNRKRGEREIEEEEVEQKEKGGEGKQKGGYTRIERKSEREVKCHYYSPNR